MEKLWCPTCNRDGLKEDDENYQCIFCGSYFNEKQDIIDDWNKTKKEKININEFNGQGIA